MSFEAMRTAFDECLNAAIRDGDVPAIRARAQELVANDPIYKRLAALALMWAGDSAEALENMPEQDHALRGRLHARLGQYGEAVSEIGLALEHGDANADSAAREVAGFISRAGRPLPVFKGAAGRRWAMEPSSKPGTMRPWGEALRQGDWERGIAAMKRDKDYGTGGDCSSPRTRIERDPIPPWNGERVDHLVLLSEHGNGDFFQFGRYVSLARERCARLSLVVEPCLQAIAKRCLPVDDVVQSGQGAPLLQVADAFALLAPLLADALGVRYARPWRIEPVKDSVPDLGAGSHIGLCWSASPFAGVLRDCGGRREIPFASLRRLKSLPGVRFHSLQHGAGANQAEPWVRRHDLSPYDVTVSLLAALDAVITVDTSVAHLAANVGKPVHLILSDYEDWRWQTGETTPWYPTVTIYRGNVYKSVKRICERLASGATAKRAA